MVIFMNIESLLMSDDVVSSIKDNMDCLLELIPEINNMIGFEHKHPHHHLDVWNHTLMAVSLSNNDFELRLVLLLHDIGKPHSYTEGEVRHFYGHPVVSALMSKNILERLGYDKLFIDEVCYLIRMHDTPISMNDIYYNYELEYKRYLVQTCDALAHNPDKLEKRKNYLKKTKKLFMSNNIENK